MSDCKHGNPQAEWCHDCEDEVAEDANTEGFNAGLEAAAKECEKTAEEFEAQAKRYYPDTSSHDDYAQRAGDARTLAARIRGMKEMTREMKEDEVRDEMKARLVSEKAQLRAYYGKRIERLTEALINGLQVVTRIEAHLAGDMIDTDQANAQRNVRLLRSILDAALESGVGEKC